MLNPFKAALRLQNICIYVRMLYATVYGEYGIVGTFLIFECFLSKDDFVKTESLLTSNKY